MNRRLSRQQANYSARGGVQCARVHQFVYGGCPWREIVLRFVSPCVNEERANAHDSAEDLGLN